MYNLVIYICLLKNKLYFLTVFFIFLSSNLLFYKNASSNIIRDVEIEEIIRNWSNPIFDAAGLNKDSIEIFIVADKSINAFVANGQKVFLNTGLIFKSSSANGLIGVIAHETGHIASGHIVRTMERIRSIEKNQMITSLISIGLFALGSQSSELKGNKGNFGRAILSISPEIARRRFFSFTRMNEHSADTAAVKYLKKVNRDPASLLVLLEKLYGQELLLYERQDPFLRTHPLTKSRMDQIKSQVGTNKSVKDRPEDKLLYERLVAKLDGFLNSPGKVLLKYPVVNQSLAARYARSIAYYRIPQVNKAIVEINNLISDFPQDPYFQELKGQILYENGHIRDSLESFNKALRLKPDSTLITLALSAAKIETNDNIFLEEVINDLEAILLKEPNNILAWDLKGTAHYRKGEEALSQLSAAESAIRKGKIKEAEMFIKRARKKFVLNSPADIRAQDILKIIVRNHK